MEVNRLANCLGVLLAIGMLLMPGTSDGAEPLEQRLSRLIELEDSTAGQLSSTKRAARIAAGFDRNFGRLSEADLRDLELAALQAYFRAAELAQFYAHRAQDIETMEAALSELARRQQASPEDLQGMFGAYMSMRAFDKASRFATAHELQTSEAVPTVADRLPPGFVGATLLQPATSGDEAARIPFAPTTDAYIVAVSHPMCRFTRSAIAAIEADARLARIFGDHAYWVAPADRRLHLDVLRAWGQDHPLTPFAIAWRRDEWPEIDHWNTPTFYFFKRGRPVAKVTGWPDEGRKSELLAAAAKAGLD